MKNKRYIGSLIAEVMISIVLLLLPYKRYKPVGVFGGIGQEETESVFDLLRQPFTGNCDFVGLLIYLAIFLAILSPSLILAELLLLRRFDRARFLLPVQGLLLLCGAFFFG